MSGGTFQVPRGCHRRGQRPDLTGHSLSLHPVICCPATQKARPRLHSDPTLDTVTSLCLPGRVAGEQQDTEVSGVRKGASLRPFPGGGGRRPWSRVRRPHGRTRSDLCRPVGTGAVTKAATAGRGSAQSASSGGGGAMKPLLPGRAPLHRLPGLDVGASCKTSATTGPGRKGEMQAQIPAASLSLPQPLFSYLGSGGGRPLLWRPGAAWLVPRLLRGVPVRTAAHTPNTYTYLPGARAAPSCSVVSATVVLGVGALGGAAEEPPLPGPAPRPSPPVTQICADCGHGHLAPPPVLHRRSRPGREQTPAHPKRCESLHSPCPLGLGALAASCVVLGWAGGESETPTEAANPERPGLPSVPCPVLGPPPTQCRKAGGNGLGLTQVPPIAGHGVATRPHSSTPGGPRELTQ